ncbi:hypothetical protein [Acetivibrio cellulolyticus]|uniref:hypothetical protein n=1 Tax=Acetivibrio cellulolyticus TaxID=35830 RepID=UPI0001E2E26D|nr:hypothetical protein [Acetivibrio cellulolyticus]
MNDDELNAKFKQIAQMLGKDNVNVPDNLGSIISMLANSAPKEQAAPKTEDLHSPVEHKEIKEESSPKNPLDDNMEMMRKVTTMMSSMRNVNDPRVNLLTAISPFLNNTRQKKIGNCIKLFQMTQLTRMMTEMEKNN